MGSNFKSENSKKSITKHFMSPTVSATSKVTLPRKKILSDKNESAISWDNSTHSRKSPFSEVKNGIIQADSPLRPYDPLTNYLSPRPKFLRYKPNRRSEILQRTGVLSSHSWRVVDDQKTCECDQEEDSVSSSQESSSEIMMVMAEDNYHDVSEILQRSGILSSQKQEVFDEQISSECDQEEDSSGSSPQKKSSLIMMVKAEANHHDGQDADDDEEEETEEVEEQKSWFLKGLVKFLLLLVVLGLLTFYILSMNDFRPLPIVQAVGGLMEGYHSIQRHLSEAVYTNVQNRPWRNGSEVLQGYVRMLVVHLNDDHEQRRNQIDIDEEEWDESLDEIIEMPEPQSDKVEWDEITDNQFSVFESVQADAATDKKLDKVEKLSEGLQPCASLGKYEHFHEWMDHTQSTSRKEPASLTYKADQIGQERTGGPIAIRDDEKYHRAEELNKIYVEEEANETELQIYDVTASSAGDQIFLLDKIEPDVDTLPYANTFEIDNKSMKDINFLDLETIAIAMIMLSIFSTLLASLVYSYRLRATPAAVHDSQLDARDGKEKLIQAQACVQVEHAEETAKIVIKPSFESFSFEKAREAVIFTHAPNIELLGEFAIGEFSSVRSSDQKGKKIETAESSYSISHMVSRAHPVAQPQTLNVSSTESPSYGSFTAEKTVLKKEGCRDGNVKVVTTPVRRSSRIRSRSATSP